MKFTFPALLAAVTLVNAFAAEGAAPVLTPGNVSIGNNLETYTTVAFSEPVQADLQLTLTSSDPGRLLLAKTPDVAGSPSITLKVRARFRESPEFWLQALGDSGQVNYTASAPGYESKTGTVTLTPSAIVLIGPYGANAPEFATTLRGLPMKITLHSVRLDASLNFVEQQYVRGGLPLDVKVQTSDPRVGVVTTSPVRFGVAGDTAITQFKPVAAGKTTLSVVQPPGFRAAARLNSVIATVRTPGIAISNEMTVGQNLQLPVALSLGEPAPEGGLAVTLTSSDPKKLLLSAAATEVGKASITINVPPGGVSAPYYLQALDCSGVVKHTASADGYASRTGSITLAPSGVIISLPAHGPPDEAEVFRPDSAGGHQNMFVALLSEHKPTDLVVYTAFLDPATKRAADITVEQLRAGLTLSVDLKNSAPAVGTVPSRVTINGGSERTLTQFTPLSAGKTVISVGTPQGFVTPSNSTELLAIVRE
jgi:hypothetical protein